MIDRDLLQRIDACRTGSEDFDDPGLALAKELENQEARELYDRVQAMDRALGEAVHEVPVPAGLSERLLAHLAATQIVDAAVQEPTPSLPGKTTLAVSRRRWPRWAAGLTVAASVALVVTAFYLRPTRLTEQHVAREPVLQFYNQEQRSAGNNLPAGLPFSRHVNLWPGTTWRTVVGFLNRSGLDGVAYELLYNGTEATLYAMPVQAAGLPNSPPQKIGPVTGNRAVAAWQEGPTLYVLVVQGGERAYQSFVKRDPLI